MENNEREDLEHLMSLPGWTRFREYVEREWGAGGARFLQAVTKAADLNADADATAQLRQVIVAQREIQKVLQWPEDRVHKLKQHEQLLRVGINDVGAPEPVGSRRGRL